MDLEKGTSSLVRTGFLIYFWLLALSDSWENQEQPLDAVLSLALKSSQKSKYKRLYRLFRRFGICLGPQWKCFLLNGFNST